MNESEEQPKENAPGVKVHHRANKLKIKAGSSQHEGPGYIDPYAIDRAETIVQKKEALYKNEVEDNLARLGKAWEKMKSSDAKTLEEAEEELYHYSNHIKDIAATYRYELMAHFGESLRAFSERIDVKDQKHLIIVQAHIDVMGIVFRENIKGHGDDKASELKEIVAKAIEKYG